MSDEMFVKDTYKNLSQAEQQREIKWLQETRAMNLAFQNATMKSWNGNNQESSGNDQENKDENNKENSKKSV